MQRVIAQAHRRPQPRQQRGRRHIDRVQILRGHGHLLALILPEMRDQRAHLVQHGDGRADREADREAAHRDDTRRDHRHQRDRPERGRRIGAVEADQRLALGHAAAELWVDRQRGVPLDHDLAQAGDDPGQGRQDGEADQQPQRRQCRHQDEHRQRPWLHQRQRQIFGIVRRAITRLGVVQVVHPLIHEGGRQQRYADQRVPAFAETRQRRMLHMADFVDEQQRAIERQHRHDRSDDDHPRRRCHDRHGQRRITDQRATHHVAPVQAGTRRDQVAGQLGGGAQHRLVVRNRDTHGRGRWDGLRTPFKRKRRFHSSILCPHIVATRWHSHVQR